MGWGLKAVSLVTRAVTVRQWVGMASCIEGQWAQVWLWLS